MTKRVTTEKDHVWKVRVSLPGALIHLASRTEPTAKTEGGRLIDVVAEWLDDPEQGDTLGFIDWTQANALTWRWTGQCG